ncbi:unnamed protein product, partial [Prorocentrum cordatum]
ARPRERRGRGRAAAAVGEGLGPRGDAPHEDGSCVRWHGKPRAVTCAIKRGAGATRHIMEEEEEEEKNTEDEEEEEEEEEEAFTRKLTRATCAPASAQSAPFSSVALVAAWRLHTAHRTAPIDDRLCWEDSVRLRLQPHPSFGCASHLQGTRESRNRWARPPSAGRRAASRRVEKAITKNPVRASVLWAIPNCSIHALHRVLES